VREKRRRKRRRRRRRERKSETFERSAIPRKSDDRSHDRIQPIISTA